MIFFFFSMILKCEIYPEITSLPKTHVRLDLVGGPKSGYISFDFIAYSKVMRRDWNLTEISSFTVRCPPPRILHNPWDKHLPNF